MKPTSSEASSVEPPAASSERSSAAASSVNEPLFVSSAGGQAELGAYEGVPEEAHISPQDLKSLIDAGTGAGLIDVRTYGDYFSDGFIDGFENVPFNQIAIRGSEVTRYDSLILVGSEGDQVSDAYAAVLDLGFEASAVQVLEGGLNAWEAAGFPITVIDTEHTC